MNFLAHSYLADLTSTSQAGSLMGDFVRGPLEGRYPADIERGIRLHRRVDSYTDQHAVVTAARRRIPPPFRRYAGILLDMYFDHYLARDWQEHHLLPLEHYLENYYRTLAEQEMLFDEQLQQGIRYMRERQLLLSYREIAGIEKALSGLSTRLSRPNPIAEGAVILRSQYLELEEDFRSFLPDLVRFARETAAAT